MDVCQRTLDETKTGALGGTKIPDPARPSGNPLNLQEMISTALERRLARYFCQVHLGLAGSKPS